LNDAKNKLAAAASTYGKFTDEGIAEFFSGFKFDVETFDIPLFDFSKILSPDKISVDGYERDAPGFTETEFPLLENKGEPELTQLTFIVHRSQKEAISRAISIARTKVDQNEQNQNSNGNALDYICRTY